MAKNASISTQRRWSRGLARRWWRRVASRGSRHAVLVPDRHQHAAVGVAADGLRPVAGRAGPAAAGHPGGGGSPSCPRSASPPRWAASRNRPIPSGRPPAGRWRCSPFCRWAGPSARTARCGCAPRTAGWRSPAAGSHWCSASRSSPCATRWACCSASCRRLRAEPFWICLSGAVGGMVAGIGIGWLANLLRRARRAMVVAPCA